VPTIFLSGDQAAADDLRAVVPQAELAVVKEGFSNYACQTLSAQSARELIHDGARRGMQRIGEIKPYRIEGPVTIQIEYTTRNALGVDANLRPGVEVIDARTIRYSGKDFMEAWTRYERH
jgi:D-amino peptidase